MVGGYCLTYIYTVAYLGTTWRGVPQCSFFYLSQASQPASSSEKRCFPQMYFLGLKRLRSLRARNACFVISGINQSNGTSPWGCFGNHTPFLVEYKVVKVTVGEWEIQALTMSCTINIQIKKIKNGLQKWFLIWMKNDEIRIFWPTGLMGPFLLSGQ